MKKPRKITLAMLRLDGACVTECKKFEERFGKRVEVTEDNILPFAHEFNIWWAVDHLLSTRNYAKYYAESSAADIAAIAEREAIRARYPGSHNGRLTAGDRVLYEAEFKVVRMRSAQARAKIAIRLFNSQRTRKVKAK